MSQVPSSMHYVLMIGCAVLLSAHRADSAEPSKQPVHADRTPLTFRDAGLYWSATPQSQSETAGAKSLLTLERAATDQSPWAFYIMQSTENPAEMASLADQIRQMASHGKKIILRAEVGHLHEKPDVDQMEQWLVELFQHVDPDWLYAITLDEEQVYWKGWAEALTELYARCKTRWPDLPVYQWWSPMEVPNARAKKGWVALPADGWVIDLYGQPRPIFEQKLVKALETGKPVIHIIWASPEWMFYDKQGCTKKNWWEKNGRPVFEYQLDVCRAYNVPVAYFCTQQYVNDAEGNRVEFVRWGWQAKDPLVRKFYLELEKKVQALRSLPKETIGYRALDQKKFDWAHTIDP